MNIAHLDEELVRYINRITNATADSLLTIPIQHPYKHYTTLLVCLVDYVDEDEARHVYTKIIEECFRYYYVKVLLENIFHHNH